jgi:hypothetical protein
MSDETPATDVADEPAAVPNPFVPRYREPWVNPAKRTSLVVLAAASAVVLLALGFLLGLGLGGNGHRRGFEMRPGGYGGYGSGYGSGYSEQRRMPPWAPGHVRPGWRYRVPGAPPVPATPPAGPATSGTPSASHS